jgi:hypothetical protein
VKWEGRICRFTFDAPAESGTLDLGRVRCGQLL